LQRDLTAKLNQFALIKPQEELDQMEALETQKISDALLEKYGFDLTHLETASEHFNMDRNADLAAFIQTIADERE